MKSSILFKVLVFCVFCVFFIENAAGQVIYKEYYDAKKYEHLVLYDDSTFFYSKINKYSGEYRAIGNWFISNNILILDSFDKKEQIIVFEQNKDSSKHSIIKPQAYKYGFNLLFLGICLKKNEMDSVIIENLEKNNSIIADNISSFYIYDFLTGYKYPEIQLNSNKKTTYIVEIKLNRFFDNEKWLIKGKKIRPRKEDGELSNYKLKELN
ncbi:MAG: hypothetical protein JXL97_08610 [Bacteroidales bacterium]|nr:hypothetical protein [Bacteroidales bacterium]